MRNFILKAMIILSAIFFIAGLCGYFYIFAQAEENENKPKQKYEVVVLA
jgi:flagellar basal body-associated protein FliL